MTAVAFECRRPTPDGSSRVVIDVPLERRRFTVEHDRRRFTVPAEDRHPVVPFEDRGPRARLAAAVISTSAATATAQAHPGTVATTKAATVDGQTATWVGVAPQGAVSVNREIAGQTAALAASAPSGSVSTQRVVTVIGGVATSFWLAPGGIVGATGNATVTSGAPAAAAFASPAGAIAAIRHTTVTSADPATLGASAPAGAVAAIRAAEVTGQPAQSTAQAHNGTVENSVHAAITGPPPGALSAAAPGGTITAIANAAVAGSATAAAASAPAGVIATVRNVEVSGFVAAASATAPAGVVFTTKSTTVTGSAATSSAQAPAGTITAVKAAPPTFDASSTSQGNGTRTWNLTTGAGGTKTVLAALFHLNRSAGNPTPVTCGGVAMTFVGSIGAPTAEGFTALYKLDGVPASTTSSIVMTTGESYTIGLAASYSTVGSTSAAITQNGSSAAPSTGPIAVAGNEVLFSAMFVKNPPTVTSGTARASINHSSGYINARLVEGSGASPQTNSVSQTGNTYAFVSVKLAA